ncbi:MFS transporter [Catellatospora citrea]|uniref:MFS transporter n=1 Tax=Catellatospora citrea TaxID=53366 RepID=A0A8J3P2W4_9ACTN|nr:MFS transporter [Catellatospora citrea]RKE02853.1 putative MFS family arabinose efflux permease [Catellatospora citrea]GIG01592.1 MFS transporter [Catellatospora citrea]
MRLGAYAVDRRPLAVPAFRRLWAASAVCAVGGSFSGVAVPTQLYTLTGSSATVGAAAAVSFGTLVVAALWAGALADRVDRRRLLLAGQGALALTYLGLWVQAALGGSVVTVLVLVACQGLGFGAVMVTTGAVVPRLVPAELLAAATSLSSLVRYGGAIAGPVLAGALIPLLGLDKLYLLDALALAAMLWAVHRLPPLRPLAAAGPPAPATQVLRPSTRGQVLDGFRYLLRRRLLVAVLAVDLAAMVFGLPFALFPELAQQAFGGAAGGGVELGLLYAAYPVGVFAAGLCSGVFTRFRRHGALMAAAAAAWGVAVVLLALAPRLGPALAALAAGGAVNFVLSTCRNAISQAYTDDALRGRISGSLTVVVMGGPQLAHVLHGAAASALGPRVAIAAGGLLAVGAVALIVRAVPELWTYAVAASAPARSTIAASPRRRP